MKFVRTSSTKPDTHSKISGTTAPESKGAPKAAPETIHESIMSEPQEKPAPDLKSVFEKWRNVGYVKGMEKAERDNLIREEYLKGGRTMKQLAKEIGISHSVVVGACSGYRLDASRPGPRPRVVRTSRKPKVKAHKKKQKAKRRRKRVKEPRTPEEAAEFILKFGIGCPLVEGFAAEKLHVQKVVPAAGVSREELKAFLAKRFEGASFYALNHYSDHSDAAYAAKRAGLAVFIDAGYIEIPPMIVGT